MEGIRSLSKAKRIEKIRQHKHHQYELIQEQHTKDNWDIKWICKQLKISRAAYYKWLNRKETALEIENKKVLECIKEIAKSNNSLFGAVKMTYVVNRKLGSNYNPKRIARLMSINNIESSFRKERRYRWRSSKPEITAENILNREFEVNRPNEVWCTDVTEIAYPGIKQKAYISSHIDLYDRTIPSIVVSKRNDSILANTSLEKAIEANPDASPLYHSDRGFSYTREPFKCKLEQQGMKQSMSRVGKCIDNGPCECFQGIIKDMLLVLYPNLETYEELEEAIYKTYEYYQHEYPQARFHGLTAMEVRQAALTTDAPQQYPIKPNSRIIKYWKHIDELKQQNKNQAELNQLG
ncbi:MAG: IS3 family transposase [Erysipelotrichales bacterium]|nr:IS3 family transposase [Erysipelotrichales bacterium]